MKTKNVLNPEEFNVGMLRAQAEKLKKFGISDDLVSYMQSLIQTAYFLGQRDEFQEIMRQKKDQLATATDLL